MTSAIQVQRSYYQANCELVTFEFAIYPIYLYCGIYILHFHTFTLHRYRGGHRFESRSSVNFFRLTFSTFAMVFHLLKDVYSAVQIYEFHIFIFDFFERDI